MTKINWDNISNFIDKIDSTDKTITFSKLQESLKLTNRGRSNLIYSIGSQSGILTPGQTIEVKESILSFTLRSASGEQSFEVFATEQGTEKDETAVEANHSHSNKNVLDQLSDNNGVLQYKGSAIQGGNGSGILSYASLSALQTAYPNGTNQPAWVEADNSWYYWQGVVIGDTIPPTVTVSPAAGTYTSAQSVTLSANEAATIYYTLDGSSPTTSSSVYSSPISVSTTTTLKYFAKDTSGNSSTEQSLIYTINIPADTTAPTVTASVLTGTYATVQTVTLTANETATIYYTLDGTTPTTLSTVYSTPITISSTKTLKYFAKDTAGNSSAVQTQTYTIDPTVFSDTFDRANSISTAGSDWTVGTISGAAATWGINNNQLYCASIAAGADTALVTDKGLSDKGYIQVDMPVVVTGKSRVVWRYQDTNNHFLLQSNGTGIDVLKRKAGAWMDVASLTTNATVALTNGSTVKVQLNGNVHQIYINGTLVSTVTDSDCQAATKHGVGNADSGTTTRFDNFKIVSTA